MNEQRIKDLKYEDAIADTEWGKMPADVREYIQFDKYTARGMRRAGNEDKIALVDAICAYLLRGELPDYEAMPPFAASMVEHIIEADEACLPGIYLKAYKQYKAGKTSGRGKK